MTLSIVHVVYFCCEERSFRRASLLGVNQRGALIGIGTRLVNDCHSPIPAAIALSKSDFSCPKVVLLKLDVEMKRRDGKEGPC